MLLSSIFSFSQNVFKSLLSQSCYKSGLCGKELMPFSTVFQLFIIWEPVHLSMLSWSSFNQPLLHTIFFPSHWLLSHITIVETTDSGERGMNPVAMTIINPLKEYWPSRGSNRRPLTELWGSASHL